MYNYKAKVYANPSIMSTVPVKKYVEPLKKRCIVIYSSDSLQ